MESDGEEAAWFKPCAACKGIAFSQSWHRWSEKTVICRGCCLRFYSWVDEHTHGWSRRKKNGVLKPSFYDAATKKVED